MKTQLHAVRRKENTVTLVNITNTVTKANGAAAVHAQQHPEAHSVRPVGYLLPSFGIDQHSVDFKIPAPAQQLRRTARPVAQHPHGLPGRGTGTEVRRRQSLLYMQRAFVSVFIHPVIVIQPVGQVAALLNLRDQGSGTDGVDGARLNKEYVIFRNGHGLQMLSTVPFSMLSRRASASVSWRSP